MHKSINPPPPFPHQNPTKQTQDPAVLRVLRAEAAALHAPLHEVPLPLPLDSAAAAPNTRHCYPENVAVAKAALRCLLLLAPPLTAGAGGGNPRASLPAAADDDAAAMLTKGWDRAFWPGRFEAFSIPVGPSACTTVVLDVAHNVDSVARLLEEARGSPFSSSPSCELWALFGTGSDKDAAGMLAELVAPAQGEEAAAGGAMIRRLALCQARHPRAVPVDALAALAARAKSGSPTTPRGPNGLLARASTTTTIVRGEAAAETTPEAALERLLAEAAEAGGAAPPAGGGRGGVVLLVCGSFYVVAAARAHLAATRPGLFASRKGEDWAFHPDPPLKGGVM